MSAIRAPIMQGSRPPMNSDESSINTGVFFLRNTPDAFRLLDMLWLYDAGRHQPNWEQDALHWLL